MKRPAIKPKPEVGDLVEVGGVWNLRGIVIADSSAWWCCTGCLDVANRIVARKDVKRIVQKRAVDPAMMLYLHTRGVSLEEPVLHGRAPGAAVEESA